MQVLKKFPPPVSVLIDLKERNQSTRREMMTYNWAQRGSDAVEEHRSAIWSFGRRLGTLKKKKKRKKKIFVPYPEG